MQLFKNFCDYTLDKNGVLEKFELKYPDNYNFGYDVVDEMAKCSTKRYCCSVDKCS